jgi:hypothetical protein
MAKFGDKIIVVDVDERFLPEKECRTLRCRPGDIAVLTKKDRDDDWWAIFEGGKSYCIGHDIITPEEYDSFDKELYRTVSIIIG